MGYRSERQRSTKSSSPAELLYSKVTRDDLQKRVGWIADFVVYPGEDELLALAQGGLRVIKGEEEAKAY